jgi:hypothetical protein
MTDFAIQTTPTMVPVVSGSHRTLIWTKNRAWLPISVLGVICAISTAAAVAYPLIFAEIFAQF